MNRTEYVYNERKKNYESSHRLWQFFLFSFLYFLLYFLQIFLWRNVFFCHTCHVWVNDGTLFVEYWSFLRIWNLWMNLVSFLIELLKIWLNISEMTKFSTINLIISDFFIVYFNWNFKNIQNCLIIAYLLKKFWLHW